MWRCTGRTEQRRSNPTLSCVSLGLHTQSRLQQHTATKHNTAHQVRGSAHTVLCCLWALALHLCQQQSLCTSFHGVGPRNQASKRSWIHNQVLKQKGHDNTITPVADGRSGRHVNKCSLPPSHLPAIIFMTCPSALPAETASCCCILWPSKAGGRGGGGGGGGGGGSIGSGSNRAGCCCCWERW